jgi:hypothetical protein
VPKVSDVRLTPRGFSFVIDADGRRERVRATGGGASITDVRWAPIGEVSSVGPERS